MFFISCLFFSQNNEWILKKSKYKSVPGEFKWGLIRGVMAWCMLHWLPLYFIVYFKLLLWHGLLLVVKCVLSCGGYWLVWLSFVIIMRSLQSLQTHSECNIWVRFISFVSPITPPHPIVLFYPTQNPALASLNVVSQEDCWALAEVRAPPSARVVFSYWIWLTPFF